MDLICYCNAMLSSRISSIYTTHISYYADDNKLKMFINNNACWVLPFLTTGGSGFESHQLSRSTKAAEAALAAQKRITTAGFIVDMTGYSE